MIFRFIFISAFSSIFFSEQYFDCDYDNQKSFSDFVPFGGWKAPFMKVWNTYSSLVSSALPFLTSFFLSSLPNSDFDVQQYNGNRTSCGVGANFDWMPYVFIHYPYLSPSFRPSLLRSSVDTSSVLILTTFAEEAIQLLDQVCFLSLLPIIFFSSYPTSSVPYSSSLLYLLGIT